MKLSRLCVASRKPDIHVPYLYVDMGAAVLCASFMSFGVKRRWFALAAAVQLALSTYAAYIGEQVFYGDWLKASLLLWCSCVGAAVRYQSSSADCLLRPPEHSHLLRISFMCAPISPFKSIKHSPHV